MEKDPFTQCLEALVEVLKRNTDFDWRVSRANVVTFTGEGRSPLREEIQTTDVPEFRVVPFGSKVSHVTSNGYEAIQTYSLQVATGDQRVDAGLFPIKMAMLAALLKEQRLMLAMSGLQYKGQSFAKHVSFGDVTEGESDADLSRGIKGWSLTWPVHIHMWFTASQL